mmetsp:Transcript_21906/g.65688  ORF Transcript_21906/g.65688 Transcript_21906/m.65688 type:complete len:168 (-) Transcript_21906:22-525(-)
MAATIGRVDNCCLLLDNGADVNGPAEALESPLHSACSEGWVEIVAELLTRGADHKMANVRGRSAYAIARELHREAVVDFLESVPRVRRSLERRTCNICANCVDLTVPPLKVCGRCRSVRYCSRACQKAAWKVHRERCCLIAWTLTNLPYDEAHELDGGSDAGSVATP